MTTFKKKLQVLLLVSTIGFTSACAQLPRDSQIGLGPNLESGLETDYLYYSPSGPGEDATQEEILLGFINAGTGPQNNYEIARQFLSDSLKTEWNPGEEVLIQDGTPAITMLDDNSANVLVRVSAKINDRGEYQALPLGTTRQVEVRFDDTSGAWRISSAPNLTMVIRPVFDVIFQTYSIYFFDKQKKHLVPDVRWFPLRASTSTRLVSALLDGPSAWLETALESAIPKGTRLTLNSVTVTDGIASVDLSARALSASASAKQLIQSQIRETLLQLDSVFSVRVTIERAGIDQVASTLTGTESSLTRPIAMTNGSLVDFDGVNEAELGNSRNLIERLGAQNFATNSGKKILVLSNPDGVYLSRLDRVTELPLQLVAGSGFLPPVVDVNGFIWIVPADSKRSLLVFNSQGQRVNFSSNWLAGVDRLSFSISSEGSRIVAVTGSRDDSRVRVSALIRTSDGTPEALGESFLPMQTTSASMATWIDSTEIGVLESPGSGFTQPSISVIGGDSRILQTLSSGREIVSSGQASSVYLLDDFGTLFQYRGSNWTRLRENIDAFHFPGN
jgi:hypothetical protein